MAVLHSKMTSEACAALVPRKSVAATTAAARGLAVAVIPGESFLGHHNQYIRISYALDIEDLKEALNRFEQFINELKEKTLHSEMNPIK